MSHWLAQNWPTVLAAAIAAASELLPFLPTKANGVIQGFINVGKWVLSRKAPLKSVALIAPLLLALGFSGCAQYSACVKAQTGPTFKALTAATVEQQVSDLLTVAANAQWVQLGLKAATDACTDTNCKALVACAAIAWQQAHPPTTAKAAAAHQGIELFKTTNTVAVQHAMLTCGSHVARLEAPAAQAQLLALVNVPPACDPTNDADVKACRAVATDDDFPAMPRETPAGDIHEARAASHPSLVVR